MSWSAFAVNLTGQESTGKIQFEVASVRPSPPDDGGPRGINESSGGPGTGNPGRYRATNMSISGLVMQAYNVKPYQLNGPAWLATTRFEVNAKVPAGATKEQFRLMLQNFLAERFQMVTHRETKESQVFELVQAKGGHKMKEYVEDPDSPAKGAANSVRTTESRQPGLKKGGPSPGNMVVRTGGASGTHVTATGMPVEGLLRTLSNYLGKPVINATGLTGKYNIKLDFSPEGLPGRPLRDRAQGTPDAGVERAPDLFTAVQEQLGLKLEQKKGTIEVIVVDKALKTPTAN